VLRLYLNDILLINNKITMPPFLISQYVLNSSGIFGLSSKETPVYSIALGLVLYGGIYLYILFYNNEYLTVYNKFVVYIVILDCLLSAFYYLSNKNKEETDLNYDEDYKLEDFNLSEIDEDNEEEDLEVETEVEGDEESEEAKDFINNLIKQAKQNQITLTQSEENIQNPTEVEIKNQIDEEDLQIEPIEEVNIQIQEEPKQQEVVIKKPKGKKVKKQNVTTI
jgi:hypothetical protein